MTATIAIVSLVTTVLGILFWWMKRSAAKKADPVEQNRNRYEKIDQQIASGDSDSITAGGGDDLDELERLQRANGCERGPARNDGPVQPGVSR